MVLQHFSGTKRAAERSTPQVDFNGTWRNELGSEMQLTVDGAAVSGTFRTGVGAPGPVEEFDLTGFVSGDVLSFCVNFGRYASLGTWAGQHTVVDGDEVIEAMWLLARDVKDEDEAAEMWSAVLTGANAFRR